MTSSLVGSEMCIRDRLASPNHPLLLDIIDQLIDPLLHKLHPLLRNPVSYTHLTLPTICSV
eukprot:2361491-Prorocentrum_lima.AAC.1